MRALAASASQLGRENPVGRASLDYFTLDLNYGWSALSGSVLTSQRAFAVESVKRILELYKRPDSQVNVVLVGHGVGADLAKMLVSDLPTPGSVQVIVSIRVDHSPLNSLVLDKTKEQLDEELEAYMAQE